MTDSETGVHIDTIEGVDRFGNRYEKEVCFSSTQDLLRHKEELDSLLASIAHHEGGEKTCVPRDALEVSAMAILTVVATHIEDWGAARLPSNIRNPVHVLQDSLNVTRTDFGVDVGVTIGALYNYTGTGYLANHLVYTVVGTDRHGDPYAKEIRFPSAEDLVRHRGEINILLESIQYHKDGERDGIPFEALDESVRDIVDVLGFHIEEWGAALLPGTIRQPVHALQDAFEITRTDFGVDVGVTMGAPYNYVGE